MLCDTKIISELARQQPNAGVVAWSENITTIHLSVITLDEIYFGLAWKDNQRIRQWFEYFLQQHCIVLPVTAAIARFAGELRGSLQTKGQTRTQADMLIAATAVIHGFPLVTRNIKDFEYCGISIINPFD
jgi:predicted nucleic acid-binding protein